MKKTLLILTSLSILCYATFKGVEYYLEQKILDTAFQPCEVNIDEEHLSINKGFPSTIAIQEIIPKSFTSNGIPKSYNISKIANCHINNKDNQTVFNLIDKVYFFEPGYYKWNVTNYTPPLKNGTQLYGGYNMSDLTTCPIKFKENKWYYIVINNFDIYGIFIHVNKEGDFISKIIRNGISPI